MKPGALFICLLATSLLLGNPNVQVDSGGVPATGTVGRDYSGRVTASRGRSPYQFSLAAGTLPNGLSLDAGGNIGGLPTAPGIFGFTVKVTDRDGDSATRDFIIGIAPAAVQPLTITTTSPLPDATVGSPYSQSLTASGGTPPYRWSGSAPAGLSLSADGLISGTPTTPGAFNFTATVTDGASRTASRSFRITVNPPPLVITTTSPLPRGTVSTPYSQQLAASGGVPPYRWSGSAPVGLSFSTGGVLSGTPSTSGNYTFIATVTDSSSTTANRSFAITIDPAPLTITTGALPGTSLGASYSQQLSAAGGAPPLTWSITAGQLPTGLTLNASNGLITGAATAAGAFNFTVRVADNSGLTANKQFSITVDQGQTQDLTISTPPALPGGTAGAGYSRALAALGGSPPYTWSISSGALPAGITLPAATGVLGGTPTAAGSYTFGAQVRDSKGAVASRQFSITIARGLSITTEAPLPNPTFGSVYRALLTADGGAPPYIWSLANGVLPDGLALDAGTGAITGNPAAAGQFAFLAQVSDATGAVSSKPFSLAVDAPAIPAITLGSVPDAAPAAQQVTLDLNLASGYPLPITGQVSMNFLPDPAVGADDPSVQFSTGGRSVSFTIPANSTQPTAPIALQTGSVAGTIELRVNIGGSAGLSRSIRIARSAPAIRNLTVVRNTTGFELRLTGLSNSRELTRATVRFAGTGIDTTEVNIALTDVASGWYKSAASAAFGGQFSLVLPFTVQGSLNAIESATLTLSNSEGGSAPLSAGFPK